MSRGRGALMRSVLAHLTRRGGMADSLTLAGDVTGRRVLDSEAGSTRRALRALARRGDVVDLGRGFHDGRRRWATPERAAAYLGRAAAAGLGQP